jgi:phage tail-like protein
VADTRQTIRLGYPLPAYNFRVSIGAVVMSFAQVSGIAVSYDDVTYRHGLSFIEGEQITTFGFDSFTQITLNRGIMLGSDPLFFHQWLQDGDLRAVEVSLCDETGTPVLTWRINHAVATRVEAPAFAASSNEVAIESLVLKVRGVSLVEQ